MNYNNMKNADLIDLAKARGMDTSKFINKNDSLNRKEISDALRAGDIRSKGSIDIPVEINEAGDVTSIEKIEKKACQIIFYSMEENDLPYVQLGLNGKALYIPKEMECWIPHEYVEGCLRNAVMDKMVMDINHKGDIRYMIKKVPRYQYNILDIRNVGEIGEEE